MIGSAKNILILCSCLEGELKKIKRKIDDCISHLTFLQQRSKLEEVTGKLADMSKDFQ